MERRSDFASAIAAIVLTVGATAWLVAFHHPYAAVLMGAVALAASVVLVAVCVRGSSTAANERTASSDRFTF